MMILMTTTKYEDKDEATKELGSDGCCSGGGGNGNEHNKGQT